MLRKLILLAAVATAFCLMAYPKPSQAATTIALADCLGSPQVKPSSIVFACADANFRAQNLKWTGWGETFAAAVGTATVNDCTPYCAAGHFHDYPIVVLASGRQSCPNGQPAYAKVVYAFIGESPYPKSKPEDATYTFPCKPRT